MQIVNGDLWEAHAAGHWICVTTNGIVRKDGALVMGRGIARQAVKRWPDLPYEIGEQVKEHGNHVFTVPQYRVFSFPVKKHWRDQASLTLIERSARELVKRLQIWATWELAPRPKVVYLPKPGCGNGRLTWGAVQRVLKPILTGDTWIVCDWTA